MMTPEEFARYYGIHEHCIPLAVKAMNGEPMPRSNVDELPLFRVLVDRWREYHNAPRRGGKHG